MFCRNFFIQKNNEKKALKSTICKIWQNKISLCTFVFSMKSAKIQNMFFEIRRINITLRPDLQKFSGLSNFSGFTKFFKIYNIFQDFQIFQDLQNFSRFTKFFRIFQFFRIYKNFQRLFSMLDFCNFIFIIGS